MSLLQTITSWAWVTVGTLLYAGQLISIINFPLAQRLGLQEKADNADRLSTQLELMTARWDVAWLWIPPIAGVLMLLDHALWPAASLIAGGVYVDAGGREWAKILGLRAHGVPIGSAGERVVIYAAYAFLILTGLTGIVVGLAELM
jgi:hypothetical protein